MIILKVTKNQGLIPSLEDTFFEKPRGEGGSIWPPPKPQAVFGVKMLVVKPKSYIKPLPLHIFEQEVTIEVLKSLCWKPLLSCVFLTLQTFCSCYLPGHQIQCNNFMLYMLLPASTHLSIYLSCKWKTIGSVFPYVKNYLKMLSGFM